MGFVRIMDQELGSCQGLGQLLPGRVVSSCSPCNCFASLFLGRRVSSAPLGAWPDVAALPLRQSPLRALVPPTGVLVLLVMFTEEKCDRPG